MKLDADELTRFAQVLWQKEIMEFGLSLSRGCRFDSAPDTHFSVLACFVEAGMLRTMLCSLNSCAL